MRRLVSALLLFAAVPLRGGNVTLPDIRTGNVGGRAGLLYWPASMPQAPNDEPQPLPSADGCAVHLVSHADANQELRFPCGKWFAPEAGRYNFWLETDGGITPNPSLVNYSGASFEGHGLAAIVPVASAGRVAIPSDRAMPASENLRLLSIESGDWWNRGARVFDRRRKAGDAATAVQMPAGRAIAGRFDRATNEATALSKPFDVRPRHTTLVWPEPPKASDVLVVLTKSPALQIQGGSTARLTLHDGAKTHAPAVLLDGFEMIVAVWYGVDARKATIALQSDVAFCPSQEVRLTPGRVATVRARAEKLPSVKVSITLPRDATLPENTALTVTRPAESNALRRAGAGLGANELRALPPEPLRVTLHIGEWTRTQDIDLTSGDDAEIVFDLQPLVVSGTVFQGSRPVRAELAFYNAGEWLTPLRTDDRGEYRTTFWWPKVHSVKLTLADLPPFVESFVEIFESGTFDFHIPSTDYRVRVRDARTGAGIAGARVNAGNIWLDASSRQREAAQFVLTDAEGIAILPPLRSGELVVEARSERYASPSEPLRVMVDESHHELDIALQPLPPAGRLRLILHDGMPAAQAEVWAFDASMHPLWRGTSEDSGVIELPDVVVDRALLLIRHPRAASSARRWSASADSWSLDAPAEALTIIAESSAHVVLWLDGVALHGVPLAFATWSTPATNPRGIWVGRNLPARAVQVLALSHEHVPSVASFAFDAVAQQVDYPWTAPVTAMTLR